MRRGLDHDAIISEAVRMIEEDGYDGFSLRELAKRLGVKPASLYNHLDGVGEIASAVALKAAEGMGRALEEAMVGKPPDEAFVAGALAYRSFADENRGLYKAFISMPSLDDDGVREAGARSFAPMLELIRVYITDFADALNFQRALRSVIHGFIELTGSGFMTRGGVSRDETYLVIVNKYLEALKQYGAECKQKMSKEEGEGE